MRRSRLFPSPNDSSSWNKGLRLTLMIFHTAEAAVFPNPRRNRVFLMTSAVLRGGFVFPSVHHTNNIISVTYIRRPLFIQIRHRYLKGFLALRERRSFNMRQPPRHLPPH